MEILGTAALGPLMYLLVQGMENSLRHLGWRPRSEPMPYEPFWRMKQVQLDSRRVSSRSRDHHGVRLAHVNAFFPLPATNHPGYRVDNPDE